MPQLYPLHTPTTKLYTHEWVLNTRSAEKSEEIVKLLKLKNYRFGYMKESIEADEEAVLRMLHFIDRYPNAPLFQGLVWKKIYIRYNYPKKKIKEKKDILSRHKIVTKVRAIKMINND